MLSAYGLLKLLHVVSVVVWIGGVMAVWTIVPRLAQAGVGTALPISARYGQTIAGPASLLVLATGIAMVVVGRIGSPLWVQWGFAGILLHFILGATLIRANFKTLGRVLSESPANDAPLGAILRRIRVTNWIYLLLMLSIIAVMVLKPTI
jgi:uncharacterized membrane protein